VSIPIDCPSCGKILRAEESLLGREVRCRACQHVFVATAYTSLDEGDDLPALSPEWEPRDQSGKAVTSLVLGVVGLFAWCLPILGLPVTIVDLVMGIKGQKSRNQGMATAGIVLNILGLLLSVVNAAIGAYLGATGQHPLFRQRRG
jgi:Domain of unknown function (DUF4190)